MIVEPNIAPLAKRLAEENNVNWRGLSGTGSDGRIIERDVLEYLAKVMAGDEDINPTSEPVPEGMEAWPEEDTKGFFESQVDASTDASVTDSAANWASASDEDVLAQVEEEELDFNINTAEAEADDLLKQSGVLSVSEDDLLGDVEENFDLELDDEIFSVESEEIATNNLLMDSLIDENIAEDPIFDQADASDLISEDSISEDVFLFDGDSADITEVDVVVEEFAQAEDDEIANLFSNDNKELVSEDMLIDQSSMDTDEPSLEFDSDDLFAGSVEEVDEDLASLFVDEEIEAVDLNPGLNPVVEDLLAPSQDLSENLKADTEGVFEAAVDDVNLNPAVEDLLAPSQELPEAVDVRAEDISEELVDDLFDIEEESVELEVEPSEDLNLTAIKEIETEPLEMIEEVAEVIEEPNLVAEASLNLEPEQELFADDDISEMESLESILEDFEDNLDGDEIEDIAVAEITEDMLEPELNLDAEVVEDLMDTKEPEPKSGLAAAAVVGAGVAAMASKQEESVEEKVEVVEAKVEAVPETKVEEEIVESKTSETIEEVAKIEEVVETKEVAKIEKTTPIPSSLISTSQAVTSYGILLRRQIDLSGLLEASAEVSKELADTVPSSVFLLKAAAKAAQKSGLADVAKLAFANFNGDGMHIRAVKSAQNDSFIELSRVLNDTSSVLEDLENIDLVIADISGLELDEAVLNIAAPVMTLGRVEYGFEGAKSVLSISGDISIEAGAKFISIFAELIESPIRLLV